MTLPFVRFNFFFVTLFHASNPPVHFQGTTTFVCSGGGNLPLPPSVPHGVRYRISFRRRAWLTMDRSTHWSVCRPHSLQFELITTWYLLARLPELFRYGQRRVIVFQSVGCHLLLLPPDENLAPTLSLKLLRDQASSPSTPSSILL